MSKYPIDEEKWRCDACAPGHGFGCDVTVRAQGPDRPVPDRSRLWRFAGRCLLSDHLKPRWKRVSHTTKRPS